MRLYMSGVPVVEVALMVRKVWIGTDDSLSICMYVPFGAEKVMLLLTCMVTLT